MLKLFKAFEPIVLVAWFHSLRQMECRTLGEKNLGIYRTCSTASPWQTEHCHQQIIKVSNGFSTLVCMFVSLKFVKNVYFSDLITLVLV